MVGTRWQIIWQFAWSFVVVLFFISENNMKEVLENVSSWQGFLEMFGSFGFWEAVSWIMLIGTLFLVLYPRSWRTNQNRHAVDSGLVAVLVILLIIEASMTQTFGELKALAKSGNVPTHTIDNPLTLIPLPPHPDKAFPFDLEIRSKREVRNVAFELWLDGPFMYEDGAAMIGKFRILTRGYVDRITPGSPYLWTITVPMIRDSPILVIVPSVKLYFSEVDPPNRWSFAAPLNLIRDPHGLRWSVQAFGELESVPK